MKPALNLRIQWWLVILFAGTDESWIGHGRSSAQQYKKVRAQSEMAFGEVALHKGHGMRMSMKVGT